jgi:UDP:flavonoid glycosyltransferase YjiC (YdhE family)
MKHVLFATIGSLGDLHPCLALATELRRRGHSVSIATTPWYREKIESLGFGFHPLRPAWNPGDTELIRQCEDIRRGPEVLFRNLILPHLADTYADLLAAATHPSQPNGPVDLLLAGELVYPAPLLAEKTGLKWASLILSPCSFLSARDLPVMVNVPPILRWPRAPWQLNRALIELGRLGTRHWWGPVRSLRRQLGLKHDCDPLFRDKFSPLLNLALFSPTLAQPAADWPASTRQPGFVFFDSESPTTPASPELTSFLAAGPPPIVFTLGSTAVHNPGKFYPASLAAAQLLGRRAVLLGMKNPPALSTPDILTLPYAPYSQLFPHAAAIVHQGGSGTTAQAMRAARPQLFVPYGWDQPDNAARIQRQGAALILDRSSYTPKNAADALNRLLTEPAFTLRAEQIAAQLQLEEPLADACNLIEALLQ